MSTFTYNQDEIVNGPLDLSCKKQTVVPSVLSTAVKDGTVAHKEVVGSIYCMNNNKLNRG